MLTAVRTGLRLDAQRSRRAALAAVVRPTMRVSRLPSAAVTALAGATPLLVTIARGRRVSETLLITLGLAAGAAVGWSVDDPAAATLDALPVGATPRRLLRVLGAAGVAVSVALTSVAVLGAAEGSVPGWPERIPEAAAAAAVALAIGLVAVRHGERAAAPGAVAGGLLGVLVVAALAYRWPAILPAFGPGSVHDRWWVVVAAGGLVALWACRDPGRP